MAQTDAARGLAGLIGDGNERREELLHMQGGRRGAIGEQLELLADAVLSLYAGA